MDVLFPLAIALLAVGLLFAATGHGWAWALPGVFALGAIVAHEFTGVE